MLLIENKKYISIFRGLKKLSKCILYEGGHSEKKTFRKKLSRKMKKSHKKTKKNRKIRGGYNVKDVEIKPQEWVENLNKYKTYKEIEFTEDEKTKIIAKHNELHDKHNRVINSTEIRDALFPEIPESAKDIKDIVAYQIQIVLGRAHTGP